MVTGLRTIEDAINEFEEKHSKLKPGAAYGIIYVTADGREPELDIETGKDEDPAECIRLAWEDLITDNESGDVLGIAYLEKY